ncbi:MAG: LexA family protein [Mesorhizobium sp.]
MHFAGMDKIAGDRLKQARIDAGYQNAREAADALGVNYTTYGQHENGTRNIPARSAERYARKFKVSLEWLLTGRGNHGAKNLTMSLSKSAKLGMVPVKGYVKAGQWYDIDDWGASSMAEVVPSSSDYPLEWQYAYIVDGESLNKTARHGDRLVCIDLIESGTGFIDGDLVIVERSRFGGQMIETTAKRARKTMTGWELWPESTDPEHQQPIPYDLGQENAEVRVVAKVIWILRKP